MEPNTMGKREIRNEDYIYEAKIHEPLPTHIARCPCDAEMESDGHESKSGDGLPSEKAEKQYRNG